MKMSIYITSKCDAFKLGIYQRGCVATVELVDPYMEVRPANITRMKHLTNNYECNHTETMQKRNEFVGKS